ncbi:EAL domain-containing protein [Parvibaculum sp. MBR-TMA-1.3b-4.2]|jgi:EAL domain-containing protein (putative c-di-GMP-specific phosphodiesterase class I)
MYSSSFRLTNRDIDLAFEARHLFLVFQPRISLVDGTILGAEAYVRWTHPEYGLLPPGLFLSFFERRERAGELTRYVAARAAETLVFWQEKGQDWPISINLSASDVNDAGLAGALDGIMAAHDLDPSCLTIEIPEGAIARSPDTATRTIRELKRMGFRTALDGGGAVIVPDELLTPDCFNEVKIGGASIIQFAKRVKKSGIGFVGKRVTLASGRGMDATAVGVENETTLTALRELGFTAAQGTYICRPMKPEELVGWHYAAPAASEEDEILLLEPLGESAFRQTVEEETQEAELPVATPVQAESLFDPATIELRECDELEPADELEDIDATENIPPVDDDREALAAIRNEVMSLAGYDEPEMISGAFELAPDEELEEEFEDEDEDEFVEPHEEDQDDEREEAPVFLTVVEAPPVLDATDEPVHIAEQSSAIEEPVQETGDELILDYTALDFELPGEEIRMVAWRIDRVCLFPGRELVRRMPRPKRRRRPAGKRPARSGTKTARGKTPVTRRAKNTQGNPRRPAPPRKRQRRKTQKRSFLERALGL